VIAVEFIKYED